MFYTITKNGLIMGMLGTIMVFVALFIMLFGLGDPPSSPAIATDDGIVIVIDPGHGGIDGGATANGILEKDLNLAIALKLRDIINENGDTAVLTRETDDTSFANNSNGKYIKKNDLLHRLSVAEDSDADLFLSIHMNKFEQPQYSGAQVFYQTDSEDSKKLGESIQASLINNLDNTNTRVAKKNENNVYILKNAKSPISLIECGFLSNPEELKNLTDDEYQKKLAESIYKGVCDYYK